MKIVFFVCPQTHYIYIRINVTLVIIRKKMKERNLGYQSNTAHCIKAHDLRVMKPLLPLDSKTYVGTRYGLRRLGTPDLLIP